jgi:hypothetical protein
VHQHERRALTALPHGERSPVRRNDRVGHRRTPA